MRECRPGASALLGFLLNQDAEGATARIRGSGAANPFESVFRDEELASYEEVVVDGAGGESGGLIPCRAP